jgi:RimJ/RimL family protein N-acetyltransferase
MKLITETERLLLREFTADDALLILQLNSDPRVTRYTGDPVRDEQHASEVLTHIILPQYSLYGHGRWAVHTRQDGAFIGWCGLKTRPERGEVDLGFRFLASTWGKGYATESAWASLRVGFDKLALPRIVGRAMPENLASLRVLEKCGMRYVCDEIVDEHPARTYEALYPFIR